MSEYNQRDEYFKLLQDFVAKAAQETGHYHRLKGLDNVQEMVDACQKLEINRVKKMQGDLFKSAKIQAYLKTEVAS